MNETSESLRRHIDGARELKSVVGTMKALAAANISQFEKAVISLADYYRAVELGLAVSLRESATSHRAREGAESAAGGIGAVVFGSDQGLVGQFNDRLARFAAGELNARPGRKTVWAVGERVYSCLLDERLRPEEPSSVPNSVAAITPLVARLLLEIEQGQEDRGIERVLLFHNCPRAGAAYDPVCRRLLPLDARWRAELEAVPWPTRMLPQVVAGGEATLTALVREYLFVSLFRACAESLSSENASRLAAMQRAERNIHDLLEGLNRTFHQLRQSSIDAELFDLVSGFDALSNDRRRRPEHPGARNSEQ